MAQVAVLSAELKTPETPLDETAFNQDAIEKGQGKKSPFVAVWNMRALRMYRTPAYPRKAFLAEDLVFEISPDTQLVKAVDWLKPSIKSELHRRCDRLLVALNDVLTKGTVEGAVVDATVFVGFLRESIRRIRLVVEGDVVTALANSRKLRLRIDKWSREQGLKYLVSDVNAAIGGQITYRLLGQVLFYLSYRRHEPSLPALALTTKEPLQDQLRVHWDAIRAYDFEALYAPTTLDEIPLGTQAQTQVRGLIDDLAQYDWDSIRDDVLGSVFKNLIPLEERIALGQYYTSPQLADLITALSVDSPRDTVLDPAVGTGTFLLRVHDRCVRSSGMNSSEILDLLWGVDISAFAAELAVINLCRQNLANPVNFPKISVRDFFDLSPTDTLSFPPARQAHGHQPKVDVPVPRFDVVLGNPPYDRSQQLDDLDAAYKAKLYRVAGRAGVQSAAKLDAFAYFIIHAREFLKPGGRLGFVTSAAWLTSTYGQELKRYLLANFQPVVFLFSRVEPFFPAVEVDTIVLVLEALAADDHTPRSDIRFVSLTKPLRDLLPEPAASTYWSAVDAVAAAMEGAEEGDHGDYTVTIVDGEEERVALRDVPTVLRNWARPFRSSPIYRRVLEGA